MTILTVFAGVEISAKCYKRCHKDYIETCNLDGHKCAKTESRGYKCMPIELIDECASNPCKNGGTCIDNMDGYSCICPDGQGGTNCDGIDHCANNPCQNEGSCANSGDDYICTCTQGYTGPNCEISGCMVKFGTTRCFDPSYYYDYTYDYYGTFYFYYFYEKGHYFYNYWIKGLPDCRCTDDCVLNNNCCHDSDCLCQTKQDDMQNPCHLCAEHVVLIRM